MARKAQTGTPPKVVTPVPIARFRDEVLEEFRAKSGNAIYSMRKVFRIVEGLGAATTADLTPTFLDRFSSEIEGLSITKRALYWLKYSCAIAVKKVYLESSPFDARPELDASTRNIFPARTRKQRLTPSQFKAILGHLEAQAGKSVRDHRLYTLASVIAYTGFSFHDAVRLRISDLDFQAETVRVPEREGRRLRGPAVIPMAPDLAAILTRWINERDRPLGSNCKLDVNKVAEIKRRKAEGESTKDLAERFGMSRCSILEAFRGKTWDLSRKRCQEFLFPKLAYGEAGDLTGPRKVSWVSLYNMIGGHGRLQAAARAAGIENLKINDLKFINKYYYNSISKLNQNSPGPSTEKLPDAAPALSWSDLAKLDGPDVPPTVLGVKLKEALSFKQYIVIKALVDAGPDGLPSLEALIHKSGCGGARLILKALRAPDLFGPVLRVKNRRGGGNIRIDFPDKI